MRNQMRKYLLRYELKQPDTIGSVASRDGRRTLLDSIPDREHDDAGRAERAELVEHLLGPLGPFGAAVLRAYAEVDRKGDHGRNITRTADRFGMSPTQFKKMGSPRFLGESECRPTRGDPTPKS